MSERFDRFGTPHRIRVVLVGIVGAAMLLATGCGGRSTAAQLHHLALSLSDLPAGWSAVPTTGPKSQQVTAKMPCLSSLPRSTADPTYETAAFVEGAAIPTFVEVLAAGAQVDQTWKRFKSGDPKRVLADLFPADQSDAQNSYLAALSSWPPAPVVSARALADQSHAVDLWWAGTDQAGNRVAGLKAPTLVADGMEDPLDPVANSRALAKLITGATLVLYPNAAHAFLFQEPSFLTRLESFLS